MVHAVSVGKGVIREGFDRFCLGKGPEERDESYDDANSSEAEPLVRLFYLSTHITQNQVRKSVISEEIRLSQQKADRRDLVELKRNREGVFSTEQCEEVMRPEIVTNKVESSHPNVGLHRIAI